MPDPLDTRDALRELAGKLAAWASPPRDLHETLARRDEMLDLHARLCAAPLPPARTVSRAQIAEIARALTSTLDLTPSQHIGEVVVRIVAVRLGLRVADDDTEAPHA